MGIPVTLTFLLISASEGKGGQQDRKELSRDATSAGAP